MKNTSILDIALNLKQKELLFFPTGGFGKNIIIFGVDMNSPAYIDIKKKSILVLGEGPTQWLDDTTLTSEKNIQLILKVIIKGYIVWGYIIMEQIIIYLFTELKFIKLKQKTLKSM